MDNKNKVLEIPNCLKEMARFVARTFESIEESLIINALVRYKCMSDRQLKEILKFDAKTIRAKLTNLKVRKYIHMRTREDVAQDGTPVKVNYYYVHYVNFFNVVKYKLMMAKRKLGNMGKASQDYPYLWCSNEMCQKTFMIWEIGECFDEETYRFYCTFCKSQAEEYSSSLPKKDTQSKLDKFSRELAKIFDAIAICDGTSLESALINPAPRAKVGLQAQLIKDDLAKAAAAEVGPSTEEPNTEDASILCMKRVKYDDDIQIVLDIDNDTKDKLPQLKKELPPWLLHSPSDNDNSPFVGKQKK